MRRITGAAVLSMVLSAGALAVALGSEWFGGLVPCALCLVERWPYRIAILFSLVALLPLPPVWRRLMLGGVLACMLASVAAASVHVGVEQGWWPSPLPECAAPDLGGGSIADRLRRMPAHPSKPCDDPTYLMPGLPVSMAALNLLLSLGLSALLAVTLAQPGAVQRQRRPA